MMGFQDVIDVCGHSDPGFMVRDTILCFYAGRICHNLFLQYLENTTNLA
jgi:hypothetical protein